MWFLLQLGGIVALVSLSACLTPSLSQEKAAPVEAPAFARSTDNGQWVMPGKDLAATRYSELAEINVKNVKDLKGDFTFSLGVNQGQEAAPLVVDDTPYAPFPNTLYALNLSNPGAPLKWRYDPQPNATAEGVACCDVVNRGAAFSNGSPALRQVMEPGRLSRSASDSKTCRGHEVQSISASASAPLQGSVDRPTPHLRPAGM